MKNIDEIKANDYGFGVLENKLIDVFKMSGPPDFETADELIRLGADLNAEGKGDDENVLSEIILGYHYRYEKNNKVCDENKSGEYLIQVIHYFLDHGFDLYKNNGGYGAQCLRSLIFSVLDRSMISATKLLVSAGADPTWSSGKRAEDDSKPQDSLGTEISYLRVCERNYEVSNVFEAAYQVCLAKEAGKPYQMIDSYEDIIGKKITGVSLERPRKGKPFHDVILSNGKFGKCFYTNLFFLFDDRGLAASPYVDFWTAQLDPSMKTMDVSSAFPTIVGSTVKEIVFDHNCVSEKNTCYTQPVATFLMDNGNSVTFTTSFGEVPRDTCTAYYYFGPPILRKENEAGIDIWWC